MLIFADGFDHYATADLPKKSWTLAGAPTIVSAGRRGGGALQSSNSSSQTATRVLPANTSALVVGAAISCTTQSSISSDYELIAFVDGTTTQVAIRLTASGRLAIYVGSTLVAAAARPFILGGFQYIELKASIHNTTGAYELRVNGETLMSASGINTRATANNYANGVRFGTTAGNFLLQTTDDVYCCDTTGAVNNNFLGDVRVDTLLANGAGSNAAFTSSSGGANYTNVDEAAPNTTDYNSSSTLNAIDSYVMTDLSALASDTIFAVQASVAVLKDDAGTRSIGVVAKSGGTTTVGGNVALSTGYSFASTVLETDPNTGTAWTEASVNALEVGVKVTV